MSLSISYLLQESLVLSCKAEDYLLYMEPHLATCSPAERLQLKNCYRRIRNREYAKEQRQKRNKDILLLCNEIDRLRRENAELKETLLAAKNITQYDFLVDGDFEAYGGWKINPLDAWCSRWCTRPSEWSEIAKSGDNYVYIQPKQAVVVKQSFNYTTLNISYYKYCNFELYVRAINPLSIVFNVHWNNIAQSYDWKSYSSTDHITEGEWTRASFVLTGMSDTLELRASTGDAAWFSFDDATLICYESDSFNFGELEIFVGLIILLILYAVSYQIYTKIGCSGCKHKFCPCCPSKNKFIVLEPLPDTEMEEIKLKEVEKENPAFVED